MLVEDVSNICPDYSMRYENEGVISAFLDSLPSVSSSETAAPLQEELAGLAGLAAKVRSHVSKDRNGDPQYIRPRHRPNEE